MAEHDRLTERFQENSPHLEAVAFRMLGSRAEADDAVQETWLRLRRTGLDGIDDLRAWLTTVVVRVCLDALRARSARGEQPLEEPLRAARAPAVRSDPLDPEQQALVSDAVGVALLIVLDTLRPAERVAFVLHDMFDVPFAEIAPLVGRSPAAARQLASRARRRVRAGTVQRGQGPARQRQVVEAFLAASRDGAFESLLAVLDPDVVVHADAHASPTGAPQELRGAPAVSEQASTFARRPRAVRVAFVGRQVVALVGSAGRPAVVLAFTLRGGRITEIDVVGDPTRLAEIERRSIQADQAPGG